MDDKEWDKLRRYVKREKWANAALAVSLVMLAVSIADDAWHHRWEHMVVKVAVFYVGYRVLRWTPTLVKIEDEEK